MLRSLTALLCLAIILTASTCVRVIVHEGPPPQPPQDNRCPPKIQERTELVWATVTDRFTDYYYGYAHYYIVVTTDYHGERATFEVDRHSYDCTPLYSKIQVWRTERLYPDGHREVIITRR